jgi:hypothetical protein
VVMATSGAPRAAIQTLRVTRLKLGAKPVHMFYEFSV